MSSWAYCSRCDRGLDVPKLSEAIQGKQRCPNCDTERRVLAWEQEMALDSWQTRIEAIEQQLDDEL